MKIVIIENEKIEINESNLINIMESVKDMETEQSILIRNKKDAQKLSKKIAECSEEMRKERLLEAIKNDDFLYLSNYYNSLSMFELLKMLLKKIK